VVTTSNRGGAAAVRDRVLREVMHPVIGPGAEAEALYVRQSRLVERLAGPGGSLVLFDVGLGAGANALAASRAARAAGAEDRQLEIVSFERDTGALALAASEEASSRLGLSPEDVAAAQALLADGYHAEERFSWRLVLGDAVEALRSATARAEVVFWDPFSPTVNPELWTVDAFSALRARCGPGAVVFTYSTATSVRSALLLAGFFVGVGAPSGPKEQTTAAACELRDLALPLDRRWLERLLRSSAPLPSGAPAGALELVRAHPQFSG
jgi:queuine tRNA-ribosyltransferase